MVALNEKIDNNDVNDHFQYVQTDPPTKESLSQLVIQLVQYQETKLGKNSQDSSSITRLPVNIHL
jgi:hypothetical protein